MDNNKQNDVENIFGEGLVDVNEQPISQPVEQSVETVIEEQPTDVVQPIEPQPEVVEVPSVEPTTSQVNNIPTEVVSEEQPIQQVEEIAQPQEEAMPEIQPMEVETEPVSNDVEVADNVQPVEVETPVQEEIQPVVEQPSESIESNQVESQPESVASAEELFGAELIQDQQPVETTPVEPVIPQPEVQPIEPEQQDVVTQETNTEKTTETPSINEHPDAKIVLNKGDDSTTTDENVDSKITTEDLKNLKPSENKSLKFILVIAAIILVAIILIPLFGI